MRKAITRRACGAAVACALLAPAARASAGVMRCWLDHGAVVAPAAFGDIAGDFIIDLSRPDSALHETRATEDGITTDRANGPLTLAGERIDDISVSVVDLDAQTRPFDTVINGVIGWDVLGRYAVELDLRGGRCRLSLKRGARPPTDAKPPDRRHPAGPSILWAPANHEVRAGRMPAVRRPPRKRDGASLPLVEVNGVPAIPAAISDGVSARQGLFLIDTGQEATRVGDARLSRPQDGKDKEAPVQLRAVSVSDALIEQVPAAVMETRPRGVEGSLGLSVWRGGVLRLDLAQRSVAFWSPDQDR